MAGKSPTSRPSLSLTPDDETILFETYQHDIIDADAICGLLSHRADASLRVRIRKLAKAGYIDELRQPLFRQGGGSYAKRYRIANLGARHLSETTGLIIPTTRWHTKNKELTPSHIKHRLRETSFLLQLRGAVAMRDGIELHYPHEIYAETKPQLLREKQLPTALRTRVKWFGHDGVEATKWDRFCRLHYPNNPAGKQNRYLFIEIDMGTETINPSDKVMRRVEFWRGSSLMRKWVVYGSAFANQSHTQQLGIPTFQVLHVTTNPARVKEMIDGYQARLTLGELRVAPARLLFTDFETLANMGNDPLSARIWNGGGSMMSLEARQTTT